ncbi:hypothetical protein [Rhizobium rhododendri]|uniref:Uncharacterized protein n=1 Tax=Rhizobium rhododendri TaxID=2506430 RepID=A0ABY8INP0_9HYPH|nr:hypothetical protein [Rhizobium rhododendri]WFS25071.1 hypothetical protein PR018_22565 [Rhizobium rhododendri]
MTTMATIIPFPRSSESDRPLNVKSNTFDPALKDFASLVDDFQDNLTSIRAHFLVLQNKFDLIVAAEKDAQAN